jgi:formate hydrogenlyase transcriptional activator
LGSARTTLVDIRMVAATHRDLEGMVADRRFRGDLYYRLNVFPIEIPPLRKRAEDVPLLVRHFTRHFAERIDKVIETIPTQTMEALVNHSWPGNIRELQNLIERAVLLSPSSVLQVPLQDLRKAATHRADSDKIQTLAEAEREHILATLKETEWVVSGPNGAAIRLGINRSALQVRMRRLGIVRPGAMWVEA